MIRLKRQRLVDGNNVCAMEPVENSSSVCEEPAKKQRITKDVTAEAEFFAKKLQEHLASGKQLKLKAGCKFDEVNGIILMKCVNCGVFLPRNTTYFNAIHGGKNFGTSLPGHETLNNSRTYPCKKCFACVTKKKNATEEGFIAGLFYKYPALDAQWLYTTLNKQNGRGLITNAVMKLTTNNKNCLGIHRFDNKQPHDVNNCFLEVQELNVAQRDAIPCLKEAWTQLFKYFVNELSGHCDETNYLQLFRDQYEMTPSMLGIITKKNYNTRYDKQLRDTHFKSTLMLRIKNNITHDIKNARLRLPTNISSAQFRKIVYANAIEQLETQNGRCGLSHIGLIHTSAWNQFSFERINNSLPHFTQNGGMANCMFICRLFNVNRQLSSRMILKYFLQQQLVEVSDNIRLRVETILNM